ncbi:hypothetical protein M427DRAFT_45356 [Gonapodya prolifera JEL478]|uniref:Uncharacterized protein n=1 Tax=Gonapodya prolifera (strain JEL478) TaxID=1344416 RepID=A0A139AAW5_GONPJ|nr:hypothetical protein M427DRAFT_45356 [Gonapodya prolifera JEL478]|eukprot:KXS13848.1 hypothetical protein M427DRAFT_45356 [Gonapodya prolifera JEL478]
MISFATISAFFAAVLFLSLFRKHEGPPQVYLLHWLLLLVFQPKVLWNKIREAYGSFDVLEDCLSLARRLCLSREIHWTPIDDSQRCPSWAKVYIIMGPEKSHFYHTSKQLVLWEGSNIVLGDFSPNGNADKKYVSDVAVKPIASPTFVNDVEKTIL